MSETLITFKPTVTESFYAPSEIDGIMRSSLEARNAFSELMNKLIIYSNKKRMHDLIEKVIFNNPATIVIWADGTKTIVKSEGEKFDPEKGLAMAISKKLLGDNQGYYYEVFKKWVPKKKTHSKKVVLKTVEQVVGKYKY